MGKKFCIHREFIVPAICIPICIFFFVASLQYETVIGTFPRIASVACILCFLPVLKNAVRLTKEANEMLKRGETPKDVITWEYLKDPLTGMLFLLAYAFGIIFVGFFVSTALLMFGFMMYLGYRNFMVMALVTIGTEVLVFLIFASWLNVRLPHGFLY